MYAEEHTIVEIAYPGEFQSRLGYSETKTCKIRLSRKDNGLLARMYASRGYNLQATVTHEYDMSTLVVQIDGKPMGTISIRMDDGQLGADGQYSDILNSMRQKGARLCEFGKLALDPNVRSKRVLGAIFHIAWIMSFRARRASDIVIEVNPRHVAFYKRMLKFEIIGEERMCDRVGAPGVLMHMGGEKGRQLIEKFGGRPHLSKEENSFYPYFFHPDDEDGLLKRLTEE